MRLLMNTVILDEDEDESGMRLCTFWCETFESRTGDVSNTFRRLSPDTENHDKNGYAKLYDDNNIFMTNVDNDNSDTTYTNMRNM